MTTKIFHRKRRPSSPARRLIHLLIFIMSSFFIIFLWITIVSNFDHDPIIAISTGGHVLDLQGDKDHLTNNFQVYGFEYFKKLPSTRIKAHDRVLRRVTNLWVLNNKGNHSGYIELNNVQSFNSDEFKKMKRKAKEEFEGFDVIVVIKYYISSEFSTSLSVIGINNKTHEQGLEMLDSIVDPSMLCNKVVYLGPVDRVIVEGYAKNPTDIVGIVELKVGVGVDHNVMLAGQEDEMSCSLR